MTKEEAIALLDSIPATQLLVRLRINNKMSVGRGVNILKENMHKYTDPLPHKIAKRVLIVTQNIRKPIWRKDEHSV